MKIRNWKANLSALLASMLLLTGCGLTSPGEETTVPTETTVPNETTVPAETTMPVETTVPEETTQPIMDDYEQRFAQSLSAQGFEHYEGIDHIYERYTGGSNVICIEDVGLTLTVPEDWKDEVEILRNGGGLEDYFNLFIVNRRLAEEYHGQLCNDAYVVHISAERKGKYNTRPDPYAQTYTDEFGRTSMYLGENNEYLFYYCTAELSGGMDSPSFWNYFIVTEMGLDYYNDLIGDLIAEPEEVPNWVTIQDAPEEFVQEKPAQYLENHPDFEWFGLSEIYHYTGESGVIEFPEWGFTLTIPEEWLGNVEVIYNPDYTTDFALYVMNQDIVELYKECGYRNPYVDARITEYILRIYRDDELPGPCWLLNGKPSLKLIAETREMSLLAGERGNLYYAKMSLMNQYGEDVYYDLADDYVADESMIILHSGEEMGLCIDRSQIGKYRGSEWVSILMYNIPIGETELVAEDINCFPNLEKLIITVDDRTLSNGNEKTINWNFDELTVPKEIIQVPARYQHALNQMD